MDAVVSDSENYMQGLSTKSRHWSTQVTWRQQELHKIDTKLKKIMSSR